MMNIRKYFSWNEPYYLVNREERNLCAILYYLLLTNNNISKFLDFLGCSYGGDQTPAIYLEYAQLRDIWYGIQDDNMKRSYILDALSYADDHSLRTCSFYEFNSYFGAVRKPSAKFIQSPGNWAISRYDNTIKDADEFLRVSRFKWCFNAKPDIVIHIDDDKAVCIEGKFESGEGFYPATDADKSAFKRRDLEYVSQTDIQEFIFKLLGIDCEFFFLVAKDGKADGRHKTITWKEVFLFLDCTGAPAYIKAWIARFTSGEQLIDSLQPTA